MDKHQEKVNNEIHNTIDKLTKERKAMTRLAIIALVVGVVLLLIVGLVTPLDWWA